MDIRIDCEKRTRTIKSKELIRIFNKHNMLLILCIKAKNRAVADKTDKYLTNLGLDSFRKKKKNRENMIKDYFDTVQKDLEDNTILNLVAAFEKLVFDSIPVAINQSKEILNNHYNKVEPFSSAIKALVKSTQDINNISGIQNILSGNIPVTLENKLKEIIDYRNRIAHGKRFGKNSKLTVWETLEKLDEVLEVVSVTQKR